MNDETREAARDLALVLENDQQFYRAYKGLDGSFRDFRDLIRHHAKRLGEGILDAREREQVRRHLHELWNMPQPLGSSSYSSDPTIDLFDDGRVTANDAKKPEPQPAPQEPTMNANPIEISTKTFVNGQDIASMSDAAIYDLIASEEAKINELQKIENKPKKLLAEINRRSKGIVDLVAYLDSKAD